MPTVRKAEARFSNLRTNFLHKGNQILRFPSFSLRSLTIGDSPCKHWHRLVISTSTQSALFQEPTLLPKVRIQFADFPYLHLILFGQRLITLETWCGIWYGFYFGMTLFHVKRWYGFSHVGMRRHHSAITAPPFRPDMTASLGKPISQSKQGSKIPCVTVLEKRELFRALTTTSPQQTVLCSL